MFILLTVMFGMRQGLVLVPFLFAVYLNELSEKVIFFAIDRGRLMRMT